MIVFSICTRWVDAVDSAVRLAGSSGRRFQVKRSRGFWLVTEVGA